MTVEHEQRTLVLTAFPAEADAVLARLALDDDPVRVVDGRHFYLGTLGGHAVIVGMSGIGMRNAEQATQSALRRFGARAEFGISAVVFAGVAGGSGRTRIGDVAIPRRWTVDRGATWHDVDPEMLAVATALDVRLESTSVCGGVLGRALTRRRTVDLKREPALHVGGDGSSGDFNRGTAFPAIPFGGAVFGPQPRSAPDYSATFTGNFFAALGPFARRGLTGNITGFFAAEPPAVDAVDQETSAALRVAQTYGVPFLGIRGMSDGPGDPSKLPGYPLTFFVYRNLAATNAAIVTEAFLTAWAPTAPKAPKVK